MYYKWLAHKTCSLHLYNIVNISTTDINWSTEYSFMTYFTLWNIYMYSTPFLCHEWILVYCKDSVKQL